MGNTTSDNNSIIKVSSCTNMVYEKKYVEFYNDETDICSNNDFGACQALTIGESSNINIPKNFNQINSLPSLNYIKNDNFLTIFTSLMSNTSDKYKFLNIDFSFTFFSNDNINRTSIEIQIIINNETHFVSCGILDNYNDSVTISGNTIIQSNGVSTSVVSFGARILNKETFNGFPNSKIFVFSPASKVRLTVLEY